MPEFCLLVRTHGAFHRARAAQRPRELVIPLDSFTAFLNTEASEWWHMTRSATVASVTEFLSLRVVRSRRLYEQVAEQVEALVRDLRLEPGSRLPPERELCQALGVSRPSLREAMIALETAGLVEVRTGSGTYVRAVPPRGFQAPWAVHGDAGPGVREQFFARCLIEPELAALAAEHITEDEIDRLRGFITNAQARFAEGDPADTETYALHVSLAEFSRNTVLAPIVRHLWDLRRGDMWKQLRGRVVQPEHRDFYVKDWRNILRALVGHEPVKARAAMTKLLERAEARYFG